MKKHITADKKNEKKAAASANNNRLNAGELPPRSSLQYNITFSDFQDRKEHFLMEQFKFEDLDINRASNETIAELGELLWHQTSGRSEEEAEIDRTYEGVLDALVDSLDPKQKELFERYQLQVADELYLAEQRCFVCGFKTAMRLALESMK